MKKLGKVLASATLMGTIIFASRPADGNGVLTVTAVVGSSCSISSPSLAFGSYDPTTSAPLSASTTFTVQCTSGLGTLITLDPGQNATGAGDTLVRQMLSGSSDGELLAYNLYLDSAHKNLWNNTVTVIPSSTTPPMSGTYTPLCNSTGGSCSAYLLADGGVDSLTIFGLVPASQGVSETMGAVTFTDTVTISSTF